MRFSSSPMKDPAAAPGHCSDHPQRRFDAVLDTPSPTLAELLASRERAVFTGTWQESSFDLSQGLEVAELDHWPADWPGRLPAQAGGQAGPRAPLARPGALLSAVPGPAKIR